MAKQWLKRCCVGAMIAAVTASSLPMRAFAEAGGVSYTGGNVTYSQNGDSVTIGNDAISRTFSVAGGTSRPPRFITSARTPRCPWLTAAAKSSSSSAPRRMVAFSSPSTRQVGRQRRTPRRSSARAPATDLPSALSITITGPFGTPNTRIVRITSCPLRPITLTS